MNFINPFLLLFAAAASVPLLLHLLNRQRVKVIEFSTIRYLQSLQKTRMRKLKIKQWLLLLLRTLILLAVAFAFARPTSEGGYLPALGGKATTTAVIILDLSASMATETATGSFAETGIELAQRLLYNFTDKEKVTLLAFGADIVFNSGTPSSDFDRLHKQLDLLAPTYAAAKPALAFREAYRIISGSSDPNLEIYLISDFQGQAWREFEFDLFADAQLDVKLFVVSVAESGSENVAIEKVSFPNQIISSGREFTLETTMQNLKPDLSADLLIDLELNGKKVAQKDITLPPAGSGEVSFTAPASASGFLSGSITIDDDALAGDNRYFFGMRVPAISKVLLVAPEDDESYLLRSALAPRENKSLIRQVDLVAPGQLSTINLFDYDVVIASPANELASHLVSTLKTYLAGGGAVLFILRPTIDIKAFSRAFADLVFGLKLINAPPKPQNNAGTYLLNRFDFDHPFFAPYQRFAKSGLPQVEFRNHFEVVESGRCQVVARFSDNAPAILEANFKQGRALLFTFSLDSEYSDLVEHPLMVILANRAIEYLLSEPLDQRQILLAGEEIVRELSLTGSGSFALVYPDGDTTLMSPLSKAGKVIFNPGRARLPGIYKIISAGKVVDLFAVNFPIEESELAYLEPLQVGEEVVNTKVIELDSKKDPAMAIAAARYGRELWKLFLLLGFVFLLLEMAVAAGGNQQEVVSD